MASVLLRAAGVLELLVGKPEGLPLGEIAERLELPKSGTHRVLAALQDLRYVSQDPDTGRYRLGLHLVSMGLRHLAGYPLVDLARPMLERLAALSGELARLSLADGDGLVWVAKAQGARTGLRYDPDSGREARLPYTSSGRAWLSVLPEDRAAEILAADDFTDADDYGPAVPRSAAEVQEILAQVRLDGYAYTDSTHEIGTATVAVPVRGAAGEAVGALAVTGPSVRLTKARARELVPHLAEAAERLGVLSQGASR